MFSKKFLETVFVFLTAWIISPQDVILLIICKSWLFIGIILIKNAIRVDRLKIVYEHNIFISWYQDRGICEDDC